MEIDIAGEINNLIAIKQKNIATSKLLEHMIILLDKIDVSLKRQLEKQLNDLISMQQTIEENTDLFKIICDNLIIT